MDNNQGIFTYRWKDQISKRPAMYIGNLHQQGFNQMLEFFLEEILADALENPTIEFDFYPDNKFQIKITNIDLEKYALKVNGELLVKSDSINDLGVGVLMCLSSTFSLAINNPSKLVVLWGHNGDFEMTAATSQEEAKFISIHCTLDRDIFKDFQLVYEFTNAFLRQFAILNTTVKIVSNDRTIEELQKNIFHYPTGIFKQLDYYISQRNFSNLPLLRLDIDATINNYSYRIGISYSSYWFEKSFIKTYAGNTETYFGGSLEDGILDGLVLSTKELARKENQDIVISKSLAKKQLTVVASMTGKNLIFEGSMKRKIGMPKVRKDVKLLVYNRLVSYFESNPEIARSILSRFKLEE